MHECDVSGRSFYDDLVLGPSPRHNPKVRAEERMTWAQLTQQFVKERLRLLRCRPKIREIHREVCEVKLPDPSHAPIVVLARVNPPRSIIQIWDYRSTMTTSPSDPAMTVELIESMGNISLAKINTRKFPGLLVQGDTLSTLLVELEEECPDAVATETVRGWLESYEQAMAVHQLKLPYFRD